MTQARSLRVGRSRFPLECTEQVSNPENGRAPNATKLPQGSFTQEGPFEAFGGDSPKRPVPNKSHFRTRDGSFRESLEGQLGNGGWKS